ncbi:hypothetical protein EJB05_07047, partial [Eragrostis curvula]
MIVGNGHRTRFWQDIWLEDKPLLEQYPLLHELCENKDITVAECAENGWTLSFLNLPNILHAQWYQLASKLNEHLLSTEVDRAKWLWTPSGKFTVRSMYDHLTRNDNGLSHKHIWKAKIPQKIKIFMWLIENDAILTKDNMVKRKWQGDPTCYFCSQEETLDHLLFGCCISKVVWGIIAICLNTTSRPANMTQFWHWIKVVLPGGEKYYTEGLAATCWAIWKARNRACFDKKLIKHPCDIIFHMCSFLRLYPAEMGEVLKAGAATMMQTAIGIMNRQRRRAIVRTIQEADASPGQGGDDGSGEEDN